MLKAILSEYGIEWVANRALYSIKLKVMGSLPLTDRLFEKRTPYPKRLDLLNIDVNAIQSFLREKLSKKDQKELIDTADKACEGIVTGFSSIELNYGKPIDWQFSPLTGKRCDEKEKWYRIPDFDKERGDIKVIWEASRFSHFVTLSRAYLLTENDKYYYAFHNQLENWLEHNPYNCGANFKCGQECSLRMINALLAFSVFRETGIATDADVSSMKDLVDRCYRKVLSNFYYAHKCIKNNHTLSELAGMITGAWCSDDEKQLKKAYRLLSQVVEEQFSKDGGYTQFSFNYQRLALQDLEYVLYISKKTGHSLSEAAVDRIKNSVQLLYQCQDQTGDVPNYGFNDGALVFPVSASGYRDFRPVLGSLSGMLFGKRLYGAGAHDEEALWFGGSPDALSDAEEPRRGAAFPEAGLFTLRGDGFWLMTVLNDFQKRPAHMDQLHIDLWADGINVLCDCGTYSYSDPKGEALALTGAHNTGKLLGTEQMDKKGAFLVYNRTKRCSYRLSEGEFIGKMQSKHGYVHERHIKKRWDGFDVYDTLTAAEGDNFELILHTPCTVACEGKQIKLFSENKHILTIEGTLDYEIREGIRSIYYLSNEPVSLICFKGILKNGMATSVIKLDVIKTMEVVSHC